MPTINSRFYIKSNVSPIFLRSYEALKTIIRRIYDDSTIPVVGTLDENDVNRELGRTTQNTKNYPYFMITPTTLTEVVDRFNNFALKKYGTAPVKMEDGFYYTFHLMPVTLTCNVSFFTQSFSDALSFMSSWMFNKREATFKLKTKNSPLSFDIAVVIEPDLACPTKDFSEGNPLKITSTLTLYTYVGEIYKSPEIKCAREKLNILKFGDFSDYDGNIEELRKNSVRL